METLTVRQARRLALARAGLLKPEWTGFPRRATGRGKRARDAALRIIRRFGYLQLDTVSIAGARRHVIVLLSRLAGFDPALGEELHRGYLQTARAKGLGRLCAVVRHAFRNASIPVVTVVGLQFGTLQFAAVDFLTLGLEPELVDIAADPPFGVP